MTITVMIGKREVYDMYDKRDGIDNRERMAIQREMGSPAWLKEVLHKEYICDRYYRGVRVYDEEKKKV